MPKPHVFIAYPAAPVQLGTTIEAAVNAGNRAGLPFSLESWRELDIAGRFISDGVLEKISNAQFLIGDITRLNFNVTFEIGFAIGRGKRVILTLNGAAEPNKRDLDQLGLFDTLGYKEYSNSHQLVEILKRVEDSQSIDVATRQIDRSSPIYVLETLHKTDASLRITSRIKKSRLRYRSFDPKEQPRLPAVEAIRQVCSSVAVVVNLLSSNSTDHKYNNLRGAFLAGLAMGCERETLILQEGDDPVPIDYRDFVRVYRHPDDVDPIIAEFAPKVADGLQQTSAEPPARPSKLLERLSLGAPAAENEAAFLAEYYVATDEYQKALSGIIRLAVGRKGSGKTALFFRLRDKIRNHRQNIVLDLKPDGHQLKRFKFVVLDLLQDAVKEHVATAFWEYVLLLEICYKVLEKDRETHMRDHTIFEPYKRIAKLYERDALISEGDFSERMLALVNRVADEFGERSSDRGLQYLTGSEVTQLIYKHDIPKLKSELTEYLRHKKQVWILFDNIDKGWPTRGVSPTDIVILRALLDATRKVEQSMAKNNIEVHSVVLLRNDVYENLIDQSPDRGKHEKVSLDWTDSELLREFLRRRIVFKLFAEDEPFEKVWTQIAVSHVHGEESSQFVLDRCLMRPRNLLNLINYAKSNAVNLGHDRITEHDIDKACGTYSSDLGNDIGLEIRDVFPEAEDVLYHFIEAPHTFSLREMKLRLQALGLSTEKLASLIEILLWFSFLGVVRTSETDEEAIFIYDVHYDMKRLRALAKGFLDEGVSFSIHKAFWPFLAVPAK